MIDGFYICRFALHTESDPFGSPDTNTAGFQFRQNDPAGLKTEDIRCFLGYILLPAKKGLHSFQRDTPDFFPDHGNHL